MSTPSRRALVDRLDRWQALVLAGSLNVLLSLLDLTVGARYYPDADLPQTTAFALLAEVALVLGVLRGLRWVWTVGAVLAVVGTPFLLAAVVRPGLAGWEPGSPRLFLAAEAVVALGAALAWFWPGVRPARAG